MEDYNANGDVHGILVQLPLPKHIEETAVLDAISLEKDVDGFHPFNIGSLAMRGREPLFVSCTPKVHVQHSCFRGKVMSHYHASERLMDCNSFLHMLPLERWV